MSPCEETCVLVVGAGPVGLMTSLLLARAGVPVIVCEQRTLLSTHPKAMGITRRTAEIFREAGLLERLYDAYQPTPDTELIIWAESLTGREWGRAPRPPDDVDFSPCAPFHCPQPHTESVLFAALEAEPLAKVHMGRRVQHVRQMANGVEVTGTDSGGEPFACRAEWLVAADGAASGVRRLAGVESDGPGDLGHFLNVYFHADPGGALEGRRALLYNVLREDLVEFLVSVNGRDLWLMHHFLQPGEEPGDFGEERLADLVRGAFRCEGLRIEILGVAPWVMSPRVATHFRSGRTFFVGDAAARLSPAGGLGMNTGLQSAHNLAWRLAAVASGSATSSLLDGYERERHELSLAVMHHTNSNSGEVFRAVDYALRGDFDGLRELLKSSSRQQEETAFDTGVRYNGHGRFPHGWLRQNGKRISTLDLLGGRFVLLAGPTAAVGAVPGLEIVRPDGFEDPTFAQRAGIAHGGVVLVRPDGFVAWQGADGTDDAAVARALAAALL